MSKELEAILKIRKTLGERYGIWNCEEYAIIIQALTELETLRKAPTAEEVCEKLSERLSPLSYNLKVTKEGISYENDDGIDYICYFDGKELCFNCYCLPPHLIKLIGKFYENEVNGE